MSEHQFKHPSPPYPHTPGGQAPSPSSLCQFVYCCAPQHSNLGTLHKVSQRSTGQTMAQTQSYRNNPSLHLPCQPRPRNIQEPRTKRHETRARRKAKRKGRSKSLDPRGGKGIIIECLMREVREYVSATRRGREKQKIDREVEAAQGRGYVVCAWRLDGGCGLCARRVGG